jgi:hypothetical protein
LVFGIGSIGPSPKAKCLRPRKGSTKPSPKAKSLGQNEKDQLNLPSKIPQKTNQK